MRMNVDSLALNDGRIKKLAHLAKRHYQHVLGSLLFIWNDCYERRSPLLDALSIDAHAELEGFAGMMCTAGLASADPSGDMRVAGVEDRIEWLVIQDEKRDQANEARKSKGKRHDKTLPGGRPGGVPQTEPGSSRGEVPISLTLALTPDLPEPVSVDTGGISETLPGIPVAIPTGESARIRKYKPVAARVLARLTEHNCVPYRVGKQHTLLIAARLEGGYSVDDLLAIIDHAAAPKSDGGKGWKENAKMLEFLRPETLFGPENVEKYADPARSWAAKNRAPPSEGAELWPGQREGWLRAREYGTGGVLLQLHADGEQTRPWPEGS